MNAPRPVLVATAIALCAASVGGCITVFPKSPEVELYRFGPAPSPDPQATASASRSRANVSLDQQAFPPEEAGDRMAVIGGGSLAYVAGARWAAPAEVLFTEAVFKTFEADAGEARLVRRGGSPASQFLLDLRVERFETVRPPSAGAPPTVVVRFHAIVVRGRDRTLVGERTFEASRPAQADRLSAVVPAYDAALTEALGMLASWVDAEVTAGA